jgi:hypothetical protein
VVVLIDEYDAPLTKAYTADVPYFDKAIEAIRPFLSGGLKDNEHLFISVVTGCTYIAKNDLFSGLNNAKVYTILDDRYKRHFGFSQAEVEEVLKANGLYDHLNDVEYWYDGYRFGQNVINLAGVKSEEIVIYNPVSIAGYKEEHQLRAYWTSTSSNDLINEQIKNQIFNTKNDFLKLYKGETISNEISKEIVFGDLKSPNLAKTNLYNLLFHAGYVKIAGPEANKEYPLSLVNHEISEVFESSFRTALRDSNVDYNIGQTFIDSLLNLDKQPLIDTLNRMIASVPSQDYERFYHGLFYGVLFSINRSVYDVNSEVPSGSGYADIIIKNKDRKCKAYIIELKVGGKEGDGIKQIKEKDYSQSLIKEGYTNISLIEIIFAKREVKHVGIE